MQKKLNLVFKDLPKISLNKWYAGTHWKNRKEMKDNYKWLIRSQLPTGSFILKKAKYIVSYIFEFKSHPLDATNCVGMLKMIEDVIFESDKWDLIEIGGIKSIKGKENKVLIEIIKK